MGERFSISERGYFQYSPEKLLIEKYRNGRQLDIPNSDSMLAGCQWYQMRELLAVYRPHLDLYGEESISQLGLSLMQMKSLTAGIWFVSGSYLECRSVNKIEELRTLLEDSRGPYYKQETMYSKILRKPLIKRLKEWDEIPSVNLPDLSEGSK